MSDDRPEAPSPEVTMRIPGNWSGPEDFIGRLPPGCQCNLKTLTLPDETSFEFSALEADAEFPRVFAGSCSKLPTEEERQQIETYTVNVCLTGRGGSITAAKQLMAGAAAVIEAGGAGVFVDNSGISHGATDWLTLHESADNGGVYWAFISTVKSDGEIYSVGMQILGFRDAIMPMIGDQEYAHRTLHSFLGYAAFSGVKLSDGEVIGDAVLPTFRVHKEPHDRFPPTAPMYNATGQWRLVPLDVQQN